MRESIATYEHTLASTPFDEPLAGHDVEEYNALVAVLGDPAALDEEPIDKDAAVEGMDLQIERWGLDRVGYYYGSGEWVGDFGVRIGPVFTHPRRWWRSAGRPLTFGPAAASEQLMLQLYGKDGELLYERWYLFGREQPHPTPEGEEAGDPPPYYDSALIIVNPAPRWSCLRLIADQASDPPRPDPPGSLAVDIAVSPNPPVVEITSPSPQHVFRPGEPVKITWTARDPDRGDELTYRLHDSRDGGHYSGNRRQPRIDQRHLHRERLPHHPGHDPVPGCRLRRHPFHRRRVPHLPRRALNLSRRPPATARDTHRVGVDLPTTRSPSKRAETGLGIARAPRRAPCGRLRF